MLPSEKKLYRERVKEVREGFRKVMLDPRLKEPGGTDPANISTNVMELWGFALLIDESADFVETYKVADSSQHCSKCSDFRLGLSHNQALLAMITRF